MELTDFFAQHPKAALAFSGGTDSAFVLYSAAACGADIMPYFVRSQFQPAFERADARRMTAALDVPLRELELDVLCEDAIAANPADRCYFCKRRIFPFAYAMTSSSFGICSPRNFLLNRTPASSWLISS